MGGYISPIKLKAMAMKMRHRVQGYSFLEQQQQQGRDLSFQTCQGPDSDCMDVEGPHNLLGLKTIFLHPICILLISVPLGMASSYLRWAASWTFWLNFVALMPL